MSVSPESQYCRVTQKYITPRTSAAGLEWKVTAVPTDVTTPLEIVVEAISPDSLISFKNAHFLRHLRRPPPTR